MAAFLIPVSWTVLPQQPVGVHERCVLTEIPVHSSAEFAPEAIPLGAIGCPLASKVSRSVVLPLIWGGIVGHGDERGTRSAVENRRRTLASRSRLAGLFGLEIPSLGKAECDDLGSMDFPSAV